MLKTNKKPYTAVTVQIDHLASEQFAENDFSGIVELIEVIKLQDSGPTEAARAIRKKIKYGTAHEQLRALTMLDGLIGNAGAKFQRNVADEPLIERLRLLPREDMIDAKVQNKCYVLYQQWASLYKDTPGLYRLASLYRDLPRARAASLSKHGESADYTSWALSHSRNKSSTDALPSTKHNSRHSSSMTGPSSSTSRNRKFFSLAKEEPKMLETIASASVASTNLSNALKRVNNGKQRVSENREVVKNMDICKNLRRQILEYIQLVESEQYIGSLLGANDELVKALKGYNIADRGIDDDSDSEQDDQSGRLRSMAGLRLDSNSGTKSLAIEKNRPRHQDTNNDYNDENPFGDQNAVDTPPTERDDFTWRDI